MNKRLKDILYGCALGAAVFIISASGSHFGITKKGSDTFRTLTSYGGGSQYISPVEVSAKAVTFVAGDVRAVNYFDLTHNFGNVDVTVTVYDDEGKVVLYDECWSTNVNFITLDMTTHVVGMTGTWRVQIIGVK